MKNQKQKEQIKRKESSMEEKPIKMYRSSDGKETPINQVHSSHLINSLAKKYNKIFESEDIEIYNQSINEINDIREEINARIGTWYKNKIEKENK